MSRSVKHTPVVSMGTGDTEKEFKKQWHRTKRRAEHQIDHVLAHQTDISEDTVEKRVEPDLVGNVGAGPKDGKQYLGSFVKGPLFKVGAKGRKQPAKKLNEVHIKHNIFKK